MARFEIGDNVVVKDYKDIPAERKGSRTGNGDPTFFTVRKAVACGRKAVIEDRLMSSATGQEVYFIRYKDNGALSASQFIADDFIPDTVPEVHYSIDVKINPDIVITTMTQEVDGDKEVIAKTFADVYSNDAVGIAQAASYAVKGLHIYISRNQEEK